MIDKLKLNELPEFDPALSGVSLDQDRARLPRHRQGSDGNDAGGARAGGLLRSADRLRRSRSRASSVIDFLSEDPELAARVANAIAEAYLVRQREAKQEQARSAEQWLAGEIETMRKKVEEAEAKVEEFRAKSNLLVGTNNTTLSAQQLGDLNTQLAAARTLKADAEARAKLIRDMLQVGRADRSRRTSSIPS